ncbi:uncharacterized protein LOC132748809 [Ruditapes philippinarum]|uniref:uncharacterized protein LOC132748809 n=1 Tax=Ruditapes philippinarum TaxID=129788 RepID=UPI00295B6BAA|nr:uncharacterized protein LOC132748809 [Ruditapes philippinarum]
MASGEKTLESIANRIMDLDHIIDRNKRNVTFEDTINFVNSKKNSSTVSKTRSDIKKFREWLKIDGEDRDIENIDPKELDMYLSRFILTVRNTKNDEELEPSTIQGIISSIRRYLVDVDYSEDLTTSPHFKHTRNTLKAKAKDLKQKGLGTKRYRSDPFTNAEIETLYEKQLLGGSNPKALISTIWLNNTMHLGLRGRQEHVTMLWGDLELRKTNGTDVRQYLEFTERATETRKGLNDEPRMFKPKLWEEKDDPHCPVKMYLLYEKKQTNS